MKMQSSGWTFFDYVDRNGVNKISEWLQSIPIGARVEFEALLDILRAKEILTRPQTGRLEGKCKGLYEFCFKKLNVQYRPLFCYGPGKREITILIGATKKNSRFIPPNVCRTALKRADEVEANTKQVVRHVRIG
jgi:hypothetical protein